jgi:hypothetical protein
MPNEIVTATDWISAIAAAMACIATVALAIIAWKQSIISTRQTTIIGKQRIWMGTRNSSIFRWPYIQ